MSGTEQRRAVLEVMTASWVAQAMFVLAELRIPDVLADGERSAAELAEITGCSNADGLNRVLRLLASHGVVRESQDHTFTLTESSELLRTTTANSMRDLVIFYGAEAYAAWGALLHGVRTGESPFEKVFGADLFAYLNTHPERGSMFNGAMAASAPFFESLAEVCAFPPGALVVDVGGGSGAMLAAILSAHPTLRGMVVDQAAVVDQARERMAKIGISDRCAFAPANFFESVPAEGDVYLLSRILHDWDDDDCVRILTNCREAMKPNSRLLIVERLLPEPNTASLAHEFDVHMMVVAPGGRERDVASYQRLLTRARLSSSTVIPLVFDVSVMECQPA